MSSKVLAFLNCPDEVDVPDSSRAEEAAHSAREMALAEALSDRSYDLAFSFHLAARS